jgi:predicted GNAT family N-acyltransferase
MNAPAVHADVISSEQERLEIFRLRYDVYVREMGKPYRRAAVADGILMDALDAPATLVALFGPNRTIVGTVRCNYAADVLMLDPPLASRLKVAAIREDVRSFTTVCSRLVLAAEFRKRGTLGPLVESIYRWGQEHGIQLNLIHTIPPLLPLFFHLGFREYGQAFRDDDAGSIQQPLYLLLNDVEHLRSVESPFLTHALTSSDTVQRLADLPVLSAARG